MKAGGRLQTVLGAIALVRWPAIIILGIAYIFAQPRWLQLALWVVALGAFVGLSLLVTLWQRRGRYVEDVEQQ
jgi:O-antigen/teichoic acid export membrane protein